MRTFSFIIPTLSNNLSKQSLLVLTDEQSSNMDMSSLFHLPYCEYTQKCQPAFMSELPLFVNDVSGNFAELNSE